MCVCVCHNYRWMNEIELLVYVIMYNCNMLLESVLFQKRQIVISSAASAAQSHPSCSCVPRLSKLVFIEGGLGCSIPSWDWWHWWDGM